MTPSIIWTAANLDHPAAQPWVAETSALVYRFTRDVHGNDAVDCHLLDELFVQAAAAELWTSDRHNLCWSRLDASAWLARLRSLPVWQERWLGSAVMTLFAFYKFLTLHRQFDVHQAARVLMPLRPHFVAAAAELGFVREEVPPRLLN